MDHYLPVGSFEANDYGLFDMEGNVREWIADFYIEPYYWNSPTENPKGPEVSRFHVIRGGSFYDYITQLLRVAQRFNSQPHVLYKILGFRCVKDFE